MDKSKNNPFEDEYTEEQMEEDLSLFSKHMSVMEKMNEEIEKRGTINPALLKKLSHTISRDIDKRVHKKGEEKDKDKEKDKEREKEKEKDLSSPQDKVEDVEVRSQERPSYTKTEGQYLAFIYYYTKVTGRPPSHAEIQSYFEVTPPTVHYKLKALENKGFISKVPRRPRSIRVLLPREELPDLE